MPRPKNLTRAEVINKAMDIFWASGYDSISLNQLVKNIGIPKQSLYDEFGSKEGLLVEVLKHYSNNNFVFFSSRITTDNASFKELEKFLDDHLRDVLLEKSRMSCLMSKSAMELSGKSDEVSKISENYMGKLLKLITNTLSNGIQEGVVKSDIDVDSTALRILTVLNGLSVNAKCGVPEEVLTKIINDLISDLKA